MTSGNWTDLQNGQHHIPQGPDTAQFGGSNGSDADCTLTNPVAQTIQQLVLTAQYRGKLTLNGADLAVSGNPFPGSQIDNPGGVVFDTKSDILDFRYGTAELSSTGGFSGARGNVWIEFGNQFTIQNTAASGSTANFYVGGYSPSGMGSLVLNNTQKFGLKNGAYIQIMGNATLGVNAPGSNTFPILSGGATGSYISNSGQILRQNIAGNLYSDIAVPVYNLGTITVRNSRLEFETANATTHNVSIYQYAGQTNLAWSGYLDVADGYLQDGGTLQTNDHSDCFLSTNTQVEIHGGNVALQSSDPTDYGSLEVSGAIKFSGGTYNAKIGGGGGFQDQIRADSVNIVQGTSTLAVVANGAVTGATWNVIWDNAEPINNKFATENLPAGIAGTRLTAGTPGYYQLFTAGNSPIRGSAQDLIYPWSEGAILGRQPLSSRAVDAWAILLADKDRRRGDPYAVNSSEG